MSVSGSLNLNRLSHAYIVSSASRELALQTAETIAAAAVCSAENKPCELCRDCRKARAGIHPDITHVLRELSGEGKPRPFIRVDQIRLMARDAHILPNEAQRKVYIIDEAELIQNPAGQNAALKLFEEPPAGAVFVLCTTNAALLLETVRSRCIELEINSENKMAEDDEVLRQAKDFLKAVASRDRGRIFKFCAENENMDGAAAAVFFACAHQLCGSVLASGKKSALSKSELIYLAELFERCGVYLRSNVSVKHLFGLLAVSSLAEGRN